MVNNLLELVEQPLRLVERSVFAKETGLLSYKRSRRTKLVRMLDFLNYGGRHHAHIFKTLLK